MKSISAIFILMFICSGCLKRDELPDEPIIVSHNFEIGSNGATLYLNFTDGDGNFGLEDGDTSGVFSECLRKYNLYAEYYEMEDGVWEHVELDPCDEGGGDQDQPFYNRVPWAKPTGQNQTQEGEIAVDMQFWYLPSDNDTIKFEVKIVDRDMRESNTVVVGPYLKTS